MKHNDAQLFLNLAEVYTSAGRREDALLTLDRALISLGPVARIQQERMKLGRRRSPALPFLDRQNFFNRQLGILRHRLLQCAKGRRAPLFQSASAGARSAWIARLMTRWIRVYPAAVGERRSIRK